MRSNTKLKLVVNNKPKLLARMLYSIKTISIEAILIATILIGLTVFMSYV